MRSGWDRARTGCLALGLGLLLAPAASAQAPEATDGGVTEAEAEAERKAEEKRRIPWHDTLFIWDHSATTETLGIGRDVQSRNPTYEMTFRIAPRFYLLDQKGRSLSVRADARVIREFTDSDSTTDRGEWTFVDTDLWLAWVERLRDAPGANTDFLLRAPWLSLPTSALNADVGKILGLGLGVGLDQGVPLRGQGAEFLPGATLRLRAGYMYLFTDTIVPTSDTVERVRLDPSGRSLPSDQLGGAAFAHHQWTLNLNAEIGVVGDLTVTPEIGMIAAYKYALDDRVEVCGVLDTGCVVVESNPGDTRYGVATVFGVELGYEINDIFSVSAGYTNLSSQIGSDGQRRSVFYSPDARAFATLTVALDAVYRAASAPARSSAAAAPTPAF